MTHKRLPMAVEILPEVYLERDHSPGMRVPRGGSSCANCRFGHVRTNTCSEPNFVRWNGSRHIPAPMDSYCSDFWQPRRRRA
jgi:hypothetical protein